MTTNPTPETGRTIYAPWTDEQVTALNGFQHHGRMYPFTCGAVHSSGRSPILVATPAEWICPDPSCDYTQDWAHAFMADPAASAVVAVAVPPTGQTAPTVWIDGHPQLEAIAAAVWERCRTEDTSTVVDDPRNIAVAALAAVLAMLPPPADRAAVLREEAARIRAHCPDHLDSDSAEGAWTACHCDVADDVLRRLADEAQQQPETQARPARGDQFETWLKAQRDEYHQTTGPQWIALDEVLDTYRLHADMGVPLDGHVCEGRVIGDCECLEQPAVVSAVPPQPEEKRRG
ncbi:hypothetical protein OHV08_33875 [Streptomyces canus]|uniref:hypothetical protein n=1 Tax=Streptomyces canus TaxID=58343 RepID=UPI0032487E82